MKIEWSVNAVGDYEENADYLIAKWGIKEAEEFGEEVRIVLALIALNPEMFPQVNSKEYRKAVLRKQISLYYQVKEDTIFLIRFWNSYQNPNKLDL